MAVHVRARKAAGFTLIEFVITVVLIGIISALGTGLFVSPSGYSSGSARDQLVSSALLAQKMALANTGKTIVLVVDESANQWCFGVGEKDSDTKCDESDLSSVRTAERSGASLSIDGSPLNNGSRQVTFGGNGHLNSGKSVNMAFIGASSHKACISSLGFAYPQECQ